MNLVTERQRDCRGDNVSKRTAQSRPYEKISVRFSKEWILNKEVGKITKVFED